MLTSARSSLFAVAAFVAASAITLPAVAQSAQAPAPQSEDAPTRWWSEDDGWLDFSEFMDSPGGFAPIIYPITEPAIGYGVLAGVAFIEKVEPGAEAGFGRPSVTAVGALATENGTRGLAVGNVQYWMDDRVQTMVGLVDAAVNLDYYGFGESSRLEDNPLRYGLDPFGGLVQAKYRLGDTRAWAGLGYTLATTEIGFEDAAGTPGLPDFTADSNVAGLIPLFSFDSRDNFMTPTRGLYLETSLGFYDETLGSDTNFQRAGLDVMQFFPLHSRLTLGARVGANFSYGDVPFYMRPFVSLRGIEAMRYQGEHTAQIEGELRWQFWKRLSLTGFGGVGETWTSLAKASDVTRVAAGGFGMRYELARRQGLHVGADLAYGPDGTTIYVIFGSAWLRP
jgi:hypothetical protein